MGTPAVRTCSRLVVAMPCRLGLAATRTNEPNTHVDAGVEMSRDAGSIPAASSASVCRGSVESLAGRGFFSAPCRPSTLFRASADAAKYRCGGRPLVGLTFRPPSPLTSMPLVAARPFGRSTAWPPWPCRFERRPERLRVRWRYSACGATGRRDSSRSLFLFRRLPHEQA